MKKHKFRRRKPRSKISILITDYIYLFTGAILVALAFNFFLYPNKIVSGGIAGVSIILGHLFAFQPGIIQWVINIPLFFTGVVLLGRQFGLKTLIGVILVPSIILLTANVNPLTNEPLLAALYGGLGVGLGLGLVFRGKASTGGVDLIAQIIHKFTGLSLGLAILMIDGLIVLSSAIAFDIELALFALISLYITSKTIDLVQVGLGYAKVAYIISNKREEIRQAILNDLDRGVTTLSATGGYTDDERPVLMCVVQQTEVTKLKELVRQKDPDAFVIVTNAAEVLGEGFK